jgi:hypothetical protein
MVRSMGDHRGRATPTVPTFLVECYWPGVTVEAAAEAVAAVSEACATLVVPGLKARVAHSVLMAADEAVLLWLEADCEETVARLCQRAEVAYDRASLVIPLGGQE